MLAACAPRFAQQGIEDVKPAIEQDTFLTRDGLHLPLRHWDAPSPIAVIVALHGMSDYSEAFDMPGTWWARNGITTYAYDQRGFGKSPNPGLWPGDDALRGDLDDFIDAARAKYPGVPVYALGESMGGAVVLTALAGNNPPHADGIILVAPAVWSRDDMPLSYRAALWTVSHTAPVDDVHRSRAEYLAIRQHRDAAQTRTRSTFPARDAGGRNLRPRQSDG